MSTGREQGAVVTHQGAVRAPAPPVSDPFAAPYPGRERNPHRWNPVVDDDREREMRDRVAFEVHARKAVEAKEDTDVDGRG